jgi:hypothetical protein
MHYCGKWSCSQFALALQASWNNTSKLHGIPSIRDTMLTSLEIAVCPLTEATNDHTKVSMFRTRVSEIPVSPCHSDQELKRHQRSSSTNRNLLRLWGRMNEIRSKHRLLKVKTLKPFLQNQLSQTWWMLKKFNPIWTNPCLGQNMKPQMENKKRRELL